MNIAIACGGTGGHLFPGLAVAEVLRERGHQVLIFISEKEIDTLAVRDYGNLFRFEKLPSIGLPRLFSPQMIGFARGFGGSLNRCRRFYRAFRPHAVLGMGGFTSTAPMLAGCLAGVPTFVHESNAIPGKANRLNARLSKVVLLGFSACARYFPKRHCEVTGTPIRASLRLAPSKEEALQRFALATDGSTRTLLIMGGSQGAHGINQTVLHALPRLKANFQVIHLTGRDDESVVRDAYEREGIRAYVAAFHHTMQDAYTAADLAIARSGAASLTELAFFGLPSVLIPYPFAAEDHQTFNAEIFAAAGAANVLSEGDAAGDTLAERVLAMVEEPEILARMSVAARQLATSDAATRLAEILEREGSR